MNHQDFMNLKDLESGFMFGRQTVPVSELRAFKVEKEHELSIFYKKSFSDENFSKIDIKHNRNKGKVPIKSAYKKKPGITDKKKKGLLDLFKSKVIPSYYYSFYENL